MVRISWHKWIWANSNAAPSSEYVLKDVAPKDVAPYELVVGNPAKPFKK